MQNRSVPQPGKLRANPTLSVCMIVRDEENTRAERFGWWLTARRRRRTDPEKGSKAVYQFIPETHILAPPHRLDERVRRLVVHGGQA